MFTDVKKGVSTMESALDRLVQATTNFDRIAGFITKAEALSDKFRPEVVAKVVTGHKATLDEIAVDMMPLVIDVEQEVEQETASLGAFAERTTTAQTSAEEVELRKLIGDLDDEQASDLLTPLQEELASIDADRAPVETHLTDLRAALESWKQIGTRMDILTVDAPEPVSA
jgi:hypothetical protein